MTWSVIPALFIWLMVIPLAAAPFIYLAGRLFHLIAVWQATALPQQTLMPHGNSSAKAVQFAVRPSTVLGASEKHRRQANYAHLSALITLAGMWIAFIFTVQKFLSAGASSVAVGMVTLRFDGLSMLVTALALTLSTLVTIFSAPSTAGEVGEEKYYALLMTMTGAMIGLVCAGDLFNLWIWFELMAVSSYFLVAFHCGQRAPLEAAVKYLVQSATGSTLILFGIALVLAQTGSLSLDQLRGTAVSTGSLAAGALFVVGFGVKIALVPMHTWLPDAHAYAPSGISAMLSGVVIETGLVALLRTLAPLSAVTFSWGNLLMAFGVLNMCVGNLMALRQTQVKRLLAFSSVAQIGYMLLGLGIAISVGQVDGAQGGVFHLLTHGLMKGLAFLAAGALLYALYTARGNHTGTLTISDLAGAARRYPLTAFALSVAVLGLGGLPPLAGFMSKWQIFTAGIMTENPLISLLVIAAALNSVLSLAYYAPLVNTMYRQEESPLVQQGQMMPVAMRVPMFVLIAAVIAIGVYPTLLNWLTGPAAAAIMAAFGH